MTNIPTIYINTVGGAAINSTSVWVPGFLTVVGGDTSDVRVNDSIQIRGRGNATWGLPKKPYRIKFNQKRHLLNMKDDARDWVMLANYADKTLIRNAVAFEIGQFIGMEFTPSVKFADVYLNNVFQGNYMFTDQIEIGKNRVDVEKLETTDVADPNVTGGYLIERDGWYSKEPVYFFSNKSVPFTVKEPDADVLQPAQLTYITNFVNNFESKMFATEWKDSVKGYRPLMDTASFFRWYIASELTGNIDCFWSTSMYKRRNDPKIYYGPLWDYDIAFNNDKRRNDIARVRMNDATSSNGAFGNRTWIDRVSTDPWFKIGVNAMWKQFLSKDIKAHLLAYIDSLVLEMDASIKKNYERWPTINTLIYNEWYKYPTYQEYVNVLKAYVNTRVDFLTTSFAADAASVPVVIPPTAPFKLENYYYTITNKTSSTLMDPDYQAVADSTRTVLNGAVIGRMSQQWKLLAMGDGSYQIINRYTNKALRSNGLNRTARLFASNPSDIRQRWKLQPMAMGNGTYQLVNVSTGNVLENTSGSTINRTYVNENPAAASETGNQAWLFDKIDPLPVGLEDVSIGLNLRLGPNPASEYLTVRLGERCIDGRLEVFDLRGKRLMEQNMTETETDLNLHDLAEGMYLLRFTAGRQCQTIRFLVKR